MSSKSELIWGITGTVIGTTIGFVVGRTVLEAKVRAEYQESAEAFRNAMALAKHVEAEAPAETEEQLDLFETIEPPPVTIDNQGTAIVSGEIQQTDNPYHTAVTLDDIVPHVEGGINDYGMSYIEEEDYQDDDGRVKAQIDILMDEHNPVFIEAGKQIDDWDAKIGDSILVDFFRLCPPGSDGILYVRNHRTDVDYEVVRVVP